MCPTSRPAWGFFPCQCFRLVWVGCLPRSFCSCCWQWTFQRKQWWFLGIKCACKEKKKSQSHLLSFYHCSWEQKGNWPCAACEQSAFHALLEIHPCLAKLSVECMFFRGLLKFGCFISLKTRSAQGCWMGEGLFSPKRAWLNSLCWLSTSKGSQWVSQQEPNTLFHVNKPLSNFFLFFCNTQNPWYLG